MWPKCPPDHIIQDHSKDQIDGAGRRFGAVVLASGEALVRGWVDLAEGDFEWWRSF